MNPALQRTLVALHRWTGLALAVFVLMLGLTGAVLVFRPEIDRWLNGDLFRASPSVRSTVSATTGTTAGSRTSDSASRAAPRTAELLDAVARMYPGTRPGEVIYPEWPGDALRVFTQPLPESREGRALEVFLDPGTGRIIGERVHVDARITPAGFDRRSAMTYLRRLHFEFLAADVGYRLMGVVAFVWLVTSGFGLWLAWPKGNAWRRVLTVKLSGGTLRAWFDAHRVLGLVSGVILVPVLITALWWNADSLVRPLVRALSPQSGTIHVMGDHHSGHALEGPVASVTTIESRALAQEPGARLSRLVFEHSMGHYLVWLQHPRGSRLVWLAHDMGGGGNAMLTYSMHDGRLLQAVNAQTARAGDVYAALQFPLHTGTYFGAFGRVLWFLASLAAVVLTASGIYVWARRRPARLAAAARSSSTRASLQ
jgi:uncharacterized iron-regulated membrane protein